MHVYIILFVFLFKCLLLNFVPLTSFSSAPLRNSHIMFDPPGLFSLQEKLLVRMLTVTATVTTTTMMFALPLGTSKLEHRSIRRVFFVFVYPVLKMDDEVLSIHEICMSLIYFLIVLTSRLRKLLQNCCFCQCMVIYLVCIKSLEDKSSFLHFFFSPRSYGAPPVNLNIKSTGSRPYGQGIES